jgi:hypothetical protein
MTPPIGAGTAEAQHRTLGPTDEDIGTQDLYQGDAGDGKADGMDRPPGQPMSGEYHHQHQGAAAEQMAQTCPVHAAGSIFRVAMLNSIVGPPWKNQLETLMPPWM